MGSVSDSVETVNAAAAAIVTAERRIQPSSSSVQQKRRWGEFWSRYWCFRSPKNTKRISHASLAPEPTVLAPRPSGGTSIPVNRENHHATTTSSSVVIPFVAPPSSPTSFLQSDSPPTTQSPPGGLIASFTPFSSNSYNSSPGPANIFAVGPYAHETQLVSPPVFSAFTTEPSTAAVTPPPEPVQFTTPSSPEVPFAELLTSSLNNRVRRHSGSGPISRYGPSYYDYHQFYSGSAGQLISPGSVNSTSGTSSPYPIKRPAVLEFRMVDASKLFDSENFGTRKWGSRLGSGSLTPADDVVPPADNNNQISEVASFANSESGSQVGEEVLVDHRVSFELNGEDGGPTCIDKYSNNFSHEEEVVRDNSMERMKRISREVEDHHCQLCNEEPVGSIEIKEGDSWEHEVNRCKHKQYSSISLGSIKEFNFNHTDREILDESTAGSEWWTEEDVDRDTMPQGTWTFFPLLQPEVR